jgi:hypothetical protein
MRCLVIATAILILAAHPGSGRNHADERSSGELYGACYLWFEDTTECVGETTESECQERCDYLLCDRYGWLERRPCWNWGYGG